MFVKYNVALDVLFLLGMVCGTSSEVFKVEKKIQQDRNE